MLHPLKNLPLSKILINDNYEKLLSTINNDLFDNKIDEGLSEKQIYSYFQSKYGEWILYDPLFNKNTHFLWLLPLLIFFIGGAIIFNKFIKKQYPRQAKLMCAIFKGCRIAVEILFGATTKRL